jgi:CheY-like chemotaxis protein
MGPAKVNAIDAVIPPDGTSMEIPASRDGQGGRTMKILVVDDDPISRKTVTALVGMYGHETVEAEDGVQAWEILQQPDPPLLAILDWMMPGLDGVQVCRRARARQEERPLYLIILTSRTLKGDLLEALNAGADEFLTKPVDPLELRARIEVGKRVIDLQGSLANHVRQLQEALDQIKTLQGIVPICSYCHRIRNDQSYWEQLEQFISANTGAVFSHGICPDCYEHTVRPELDELERGCKGVQERP